VAADDHAMCSIGCTLYVYISDFYIFNPKTETQIERRAPLGSFKGFNGLYDTDEKKLTITVNSIFLKMTAEDRALQVQTHVYLGPATLQEKTVS
jgi:hypothetical protein